MELPIAAAAGDSGSRHRAAGVDQDGMVAELDQAQQDLTKQWPGTSAPLIAGLAAAAGAAVAAGALADLGSLAAPSAAVAGMADAISGAMTDLAAVSAGRAAAEVATQGVTAEAGTPDSGRISGIAETTAALLAAGFASSAARTALLYAGPVATRAGVVRAVRDGLNELADPSGAGFVASTLSSALVSAQHEGRMATFASVKDRGLRFVAIEANHEKACGPCREVDGREFRSLAAAAAAYPTGKYVHCLGRQRCKGTVYAVAGSSRK